MVKTVSRRRTAPNPSALLLFQYLTHKRTASQANKEAEKVKGQLKEIVEQQHSEDPEMGHHIHTLPEAVDFLGQKFTGFMNQKKSGGQAFLEDKAQELCEAKGLEADEYTTRFLDQDKIIRLYADDKITQAEFDTLYKNNDPTWAFVPVKE